MLKFEYKINNSSYADICQHLQDVDEDFVIPLSRRLNILEYAKKLYQNAIRLEAWNNGVLIGLVAYYYNVKGHSFHISNVSVIKQFRKNGIATDLLKMVRQKAELFDVERIDLVADNELINYYRKEGFSLGRQIDDQSYEMSIYLSNQPITVSICCLVYNHAKYLRECFEGFVSQKRNFSIEILIHDDASNDGSAEIIKEYESKYPLLFKPIYQSINQYSKGIKISETYQFSRARGKYIAVCEGDDYWTDPLKLQKQVDFMEANLDYSMCCNATKWLYDDGKSYDNYCSGQKFDTELSTSQIIEGGGLYINLTSVLYRNIEAFQNCKKSKWWKKADVGDYPLFIAASLIGKVHYFGEIMSVYRFQHPGSWTDRNKNVNIKHIWNEITWLQILDEETGRKFHSNIQKHLFRFWRGLYREDEITTSQYIHKYKEAGRLIPISRVTKDIIRHFIMQFKQLKTKKKLKL